MVWRPKGRRLVFVSQFLFSQMIEFLVPAFRFSGGLPKLKSPANHIDLFHVCHRALQVIERPRRGPRRSNREFRKLFRQKVSYSQGPQPSRPSSLLLRIWLEGVVSKVRDSRYVSGHGNDWVKKTCAQCETLPIAGFAMKANKFDGIYLGRLKGRDLVYAGKVDHGFDKASMADLQACLKPLIRKTQPYAKKTANRAVWVEPSLLAEIEYRAKSAEGKARHPFFKGIREDL